MTTGLMALAAGLIAVTAPVCAEVIAGATGPADPAGKGLAACSGGLVSGHQYADG